jgi:hypothetical protein
MCTHSYSIGIYVYTFLLHRYISVHIPTPSVYMCAHSYSIGICVHIPTPSVYVCTFLLKGDLPWLLSFICLALIRGLFTYTLFYFKQTKLTSVNLSPWPLIKERERVPSQAQARGLEQETLVVSLLGFNEGSGRQTDLGWFGLLKINQRELAQCHTVADQWCTQLFKSGMLPKFNIEESVQIHQFLTRKDP